MGKHDFWLMVEIAMLSLCATVAFPIAGWLARTLDVRGVPKILLAVAVIVLLRWALHLWLNWNNIVEARRERKDLANKDSNAAR